MHNTSYYLVCIVERDVVVCILYQQWGRDDDKKIENAIYIYILM